MPPTPAGPAELEPVLEPALPIVDAHHHLWVKPAGRYLFEEYLADLATGHRIVASVYVESRTALRTTGPAGLQAVGETEFAAGVAALSASGLYGPTRVAAAIVAFADLRAPDVDELLDAHEQAAGGRLRGIRHSAYWDADGTIVAHGSMAPPRGLMSSPEFRRGFSRLAPRGLSFDAVLFHPQLPELTALAREFPETTVVLNHMGTPLGLGRFRGRREQVLARWRDDMSALAALPNVRVKLGGAGRPQWGFGFDGRRTAPSSAELATAWRPYVTSCINLFGVDRCMFESNFPADRVSYGYRAFWNAAKRLTADLPPDDRTALFSATARRTYRMEETVDA